MKKNIARHAAAVCVVLSAGRLLGADCDPHEHKPPGCGLLHRCILLDIREDVTTETVTLGPPTRAKRPWISTTACDCRLAPCNRVRQCSDVEFARTREQEVCWSVSGDVSAAVKTGLLQKVLGELSVEVTIGAEWHSCTTIGESLLYKIPVEQCFHNHGRDIMVTQHAHGIVEHHAFRYTWWVTDEIESWNEYTFCGSAATCSANATADKEVIIQSAAPYPEECGSHVDDPDPFDGKRATPCCRPLAACDEIASPGKPCCGCEAELRPTAGGGDK